MRIVSLLPGATEIVAALGGGERLVAVSHECDHPAWVRRLPRVTFTPVDPSLPGAAIDAQVRRLREAGQAVIAVDAGALARFAPDLIIVQDLCEVCAVADGAVHRLADALPHPPEFLTLTGRTLEGVLDDIGRVARALEVTDRGETLLAELRARLDALRRAAPATRARVLCIEWLEPLYLAGHWVPDLVAAAGGTDIGASAGAHSARVTWAAAAALQPELVFVMLCGLDLERARQELDRLDVADACPVLRGPRVWLLDGNAYTSRPGPRLVDGAERLQAAMRGVECAGLSRWFPSR